jgi:hypothetical protein
VYSTVKTMKIFRVEKLKKDLLHVFHQRITKVNGKTFYFEHRTLDLDDASTVAQAYTLYK